MKSCEMHLVLVLSDHVNVGKDPLYRPPKTQKAEREEPHKQLYIHMLRHQEKFPPAKNPRAQKDASLRFLKKTFFSKK